MAPNGCIRVELYQHCNFKVFFQKNVSCSIKAFKILKQFPVFFAYNITCAGHIRDLYSLKEPSHMANTHFKIIRQDLEPFLKDTKRQRHALNKVLLDQGFASIRKSIQLVTMIVNFCFKNFEFALLMMNAYMYP